MRPRGYHRPGDWGQGSHSEREVGSEAEWGWEGKRPRRSQELGTRVFGVAMGSLGR